MIRTFIVLKQHNMRLSCRTIFTREVGVGHVQTTKTTVDCELCKSFSGPK